MRRKSLKYHDLPWDIKRAIDASGSMMQPSRSQNPTVKNILERLKASEARALANDAFVSAKAKRRVIDLIECHLRDGEASRFVEF